MPDISPVKVNLDLTAKDISEGTNNLLNGASNLTNTINCGVNKGGRAINKIITFFSWTKARNKTSDIQIESAMYDRAEQYIRESSDDDFKQLVTSFIANNKINYYDQSNKNQRLSSMLNICFEKLSKFDDSEISPDELNKDFFNKWKQEAELIDDEDIREMWAKTLVEEVKKANSVSIRTLNILRALSNQEKTIIERIIIDTLGPGIIISKGRITPNYNDIYPATFINLTETGIINFTGSLDIKSVADQTQIKGNTFYTENIGNNYVITSDKSFEWHIASLTNSGKELKNILNKDPNLNESIKIAEELSLQNVANEFQLRKITAWTSDRTYEVSRDVLWDSINKQKMQ